MQAYLDSGVFERVPQAPEFTYPTFLVYPRKRDSEALQQAFAILRRLGGRRRQRLVTTLGPAYLKPRPR
ncbi:LysR family transcriptional regulator [Pseudomonas putida S11]|nr:LysR family transcriptional regulator [Pseudomonas putida S11]